MAVLTPILRPIVKAIQQAIKSVSIIPLLTLISADATGKLVADGYSDARTAIAANSLMIADNYGLLFDLPGLQIPMENARYPQQLAASTDIPSTQGVTVVVGAEYMVSVAGADASTAILTGAGTGTLTNDGVSRQALNSPITATTTTLTITISGAVTNLLVEDVTGKANQNPSEYISSAENGGLATYFTENANTVSSNVVTEAVGANLSPFPTLMHMPGATNSLPDSFDLTTWNQTGTAVSALDANGLTGAPNTASTLTDNDGAAFEFVEKLTTVANDSATHTLEAWIAKDSDETRFPDLLAQLVGGSTVTESGHLNTSSGVGGSRHSSAVVVVDRGLWWQMLVPVTNNSSGNTSLRYRLYPAITDVFETTDVAATGSIEVAHTSLHLNKTVAEVKNLSPVVTSGAAVTRGDTLIERSPRAGAFDETSGTVMMRMVMAEASQVDAAALGIISANGVIASIIEMATGDGSFFSYDGTNSNNLNAVTWLAGETMLVTLTFEDSVLVGYIRNVTTGDPGVNTADLPFDGAFVLSGDKLEFFLGNLHKINLVAMEIL